MSHGRYKQIFETGLVCSSYPESKGAFSKMKARALEAFRFGCKIGSGSKEREINAFIKSGLTEKQQVERWVERAAAMAWVERSLPCKPGDLNSDLQSPH